MMWKQQTLWVDIVDNINYVFSTLPIHVCWYLHVLSQTYYNIIQVSYYLIGNMEPMLRSSLRCIELIACVTTPILQKYGYDMVLNPFIQDVNKLLRGVKV